MTAATHGGASEQAHPGPLKYGVIAAILTIITLIEFWAFYIDWLRDVGLFMPMLFILSAVKFATVVMFYMHLKFDNNSFTRLLITGLFLAMGTMFALLGLFFASHPFMY